MTREAKQRKHRGSHRWLIAVVTCLIALGVGSLGYASYYHQRFKPTQINGVTVTNLTVAQATKKLNQSTGSQSSKAITVAKSRVKVSQASVAKLLTKRNGETGHVVDTVSMKLTTQVSASAQQYRLTTLLPAFEKQIDTINASRKTPIDAKVVLKNGQLSVTQGQSGTALDKATMVADFKQQAKTEAVISVNKVIKQAVKADSKTISQVKANLQKLLTQTVTLNVSGTNITFKASDYLKNGTATADGKYQFDTTLLKQKVAALATKYDTKGKSAKFKTHSGSTITVPAGGTWGWSIAQTKLVKYILYGFEHPSSQTLNLKHFVTGTGYGKTNTVGDTYIEVNLKTLHEYAYVNGKLVFSTPVMSGTITGGNKTPQGLYYIMYKQRNTTLTGQNDNGSTYNSKVKYWMPITNSGVGLHDSSWQPSYVYGNTSYRADYHSHGCINNPPSKMGKLYSVSYAGEPVVVYY
ncbi:L,D-transpeptidase family protein [Secundilactobacillus muriivasis]